jgi:hypothetical protein
MHKSLPLSRLTRWLALSLIAALGACGTTTDAPPENITLVPPLAAAPAAGTAASAPSAPARSEPSRVRLHEICLKDQDCPGGYGAYGYVLLTGRPGVARDAARDTAVCQALVKARPPSTVTTQAPPTALLSTMWLTERPVENGPCNDMLAAYDHARAQQLGRLVGRASGAGPLLIASPRPLTGSALRDRTLVLDLSRVRTADLERAFGLWFDRLAQDQRHWKNGFALGPLRGEFRSLIDAYGPQVLRVTGPVRR